jgi:hypothetical protein
MRFIHGHARRAARRSGDRAAEADALIGLGLVDPERILPAEGLQELGNQVSNYRCHQ